jgi:hypothetical protein
MHCNNAFSTFSFWLYFSKWIGIFYEMHLIKNILKEIFLMSCQIAIKNGIFNSHHGIQCIFKVQPFKKEKMIRVNTVLCNSLFELSVSLWRALDLHYYLSLGSFRSRTDSGTTTISSSWLLGHVGTSFLLRAWSTGILFETSCIFSDEQGWSLRRNEKC